MSIAVLLVLAAIMIILLRRMVLRGRRQRRGLPVSGPWTLPKWVKPRVKAVVVRLRQRLRPRRK
ncbi:MAG TPA: hypothetical protein VEX88_13820 [Glaciibacter sp.]|nr:hypothetical protein [Glaciibacter sp.]